ncbi:MAG TPA: hypothetical protein VN841_26540 [Bryobacteraceae bacterium]|nr:hypothetical protein [Bryobacteraceae bacterium]
MTVSIETLEALLDASFRFHSGACTRILVLDGSGNLYFTDAGNNVVRKISTDGNMALVQTQANGDSVGFRLAE